MTKSKLSSHHKWIALIAAMGINLTMGVNYSWSVFKKALIEELLWSNLAASLPYTIYIAVFAFTLAFAGRLQDKYGPRIVVFIGSIMLGAGYILCSIVEGVVPFLIAYGVLGAMGNSFCYSTTMPTAVKWFSYKKRGTITGIVIGATSMASFFISPLASLSISFYGISRTFLILGLMLSLIIFCFGRFMKNPDVNSLDNSPESVNIYDNDSNGEYVWQEVIKTRAFYKLWIIYLFASSAGLMIIGHITTIAQSQAQWNFGYYLVMAIAVFNTLGRFFSGMLSDKYGRKVVITSALLIQALNMTCFLFYTNPILLMWGAGLTGLCYGAAVSFFPLAVSDYYGLKNAGANYGLVFTAWGIAGFIGPLIAGYLVDVTGAYTIAYVISAVLLVTATIVAFTLKQDTKSSRLIQ